MHCDQKWFPQFGGLNELWVEGGRKRNGNENADELAFDKEFVVNNGFDKERLSRIIVFAVVRKDGVEMREGASKGSGIGNDVDCN